MGVFKIKIGFLGPSGTFTEEALDIWIRKQGLESDTYEKTAFSSIDDVMDSVGKETDMAIVPAENSLEGSVNITIDSFIHGVQAMIKGEVILPVSQHLFVKQEIPMEGITEVYSHPQALFQCRKFLKERLPHARLNEMSSTALAAMVVAESSKSIAAIGSMSLSKIYNLKVVAKSIQDVNNNMTRFYIISTKDEKVTGSDKTALIFSVHNQPGSLFECLKVFAEKGLNLTKIESRPSRMVLWEYVFFIEVEGHRFEEPLRTALEELNSYVGFYKILGSYPIFDLQSEL